MFLLKKLAYKELTVIVHGYLPVCVNQKSETNHMKSQMDMKTEENFIHNR